MVDKLTKKNMKSQIKSKSNRNLKGGASKKSGKSGKSKKDLYFYPSAYVSTQSNTDMNYKEIGIAHITHVGAINILRGLGTGIANVFGRGGFDTCIYDETRNAALNKLVNQINTNTQKICNLRMDVENSAAGSSFFIHLYGTLMERKQNQSTV